MKGRLFVVCGATLGLVLMAFGLMLATRGVTITIPAGAGYPQTTMTFRVGRFGADRAIMRVVDVHFASPDWAAKITGGRWKRSAGGTYVAFTCESTSKACMQATKGSGTYKYVLYPFNTAAPSKLGEYALVWDVQPPGDTLNDSSQINDATTVVPEPGSLLLLASGAVVLGGSLLRWRKKQRN